MKLFEVESTANLQASHPFSSNWYSWPIMYKPVWFYTSQSIKQTNNGHNISETKEAYKNSDGICKSAYQRGLDDKATRFIKKIK